MGRSKNHVGRSTKQTPSLFTRCREAPGRYRASTRARRGLIQSPCGYDMLDLCEDGLCRVTYEIDEQHYVEVARAAYESEWPLRFGTDEDRRFVWSYPRS